MVTSGSPIPGDSCKLRFHVAFDLSDCEVFEDGSESGLLPRSLHLVLRADIIDVVYARTIRDTCGRVTDHMMLYCDEIENRVTSVYVNRGVAW